MDKSTKAHIDKMFKKLTRKKFGEILAFNEDLCCAIAHLAYKFCRESKGSSLPLPIEEHPDCIFEFRKHYNPKNPTEECLIIEVKNATTEKMH